MFNQILSETWKIATRWQVHGEIATRIALIQIILELLGLKPLKIISGYRDKLKQEQLLANWQAGREIYPVGMPAVKPACTSTHTSTFAGYPAATGFDAVGDPNSVWMFKTLWLTYPGARWGGEFANPDPNHYDAAIPFTKKHSIC